jgi:hypothetical protein
MKARIATGSIAISIKAVPKLKKHIPQMAHQSLTGVSMYRLMGVGSTRYNARKRGIHRVGTSAENTPTTNESQSRRQLGILISAHLLNGSSISDMYAS